MNQVRALISRGPSLEEASDTAMLRKEMMLRKRCFEAKRA
jgi:hypothetical protein